MHDARDVPTLIIWSFTVIYLAIDRAIVSRAVNYCAFLQTLRMRSLPIVHVYDTVDASCLILQQLDTIRDNDLIIYDLNT